MKSVPKRQKKAARSEQSKKQNKVIYFFFLTVLLMGAGFGSRKEMINLTDDNFEKEIQDFKEPVLVDFFAEWCPPCQILSPILEKLEKELEGRVIFAKINVDIAPQTSQKFGINPIPTVILFRNGKQIDGFIGLKPEAEIRNWLEDLLRQS